MDHSRALTHLPAAYATALRLRAAGADDVLVARALGVELDELPLLFDLAEAKLRRLLGSELDDLVAGEGPLAAGDA